MDKMSLGNTPEEKRETYELLTKTSKKWGKVFAAVGLLMGLFIGGAMMSGSEQVVVGLLVGAIMIVALPLFYYWYGQIVYYGFLATSVFLRGRNLGAGEIAGAVGTSALISYIVGGKKAVKKLSIAWLIILMIALTVGVLAGFYYYIKFQKEAKELGFARRA